MLIYKVSHYTKLEQIPKKFYLFLNQYPIINYEILQSLGELKEFPKNYGELLECIIVEKNDNIQLTTFRVPPYNVMISHTPDLDSVTAIVEFMGTKNFNIPGIFGPSEVCSFFVEEWMNIYGECFQTSNESWLFLLEGLQSSPKNVGSVIVASKEREELLIQWSKASILELVPNSPKTFLDSCIKNLSIRIQDKKVFILLVNKTIVSMGSITGKYRDMQFISDVYTPPEHRCKGYATELCIQLVQRIRSDSNNHPVLTVFVSNEKAIRIYTKIGFTRRAKVAIFLKQN